MPDEKKSSRPETFFLPPLKIVLSFFDREIKKRRQNQDGEDQTVIKEKAVEKLIEKLSEKEK